MYELLLYLHIALAAVLFGGPLGLSRNLKAAAAAGSQALVVAATDARIRSMVAGISSILLLTTGVALIFVRGGFAAVPKSYHMSMTLMLVLVGVVWVVLRPACVALSAQAASEPVDDVLAVKLIKKVAMATGIMQLIWSVLLLLMIRPF